MARIRRAVKVPVKDTDQMSVLMKKLGTLEADLEAEFRPGLVSIVLHGSAADVQALELKIKEFIKDK
ncbi:MAG: hypothetical protein ABH852_00750 [Methanobacteriota archaeon]